MQITEKSRPWFRRHDGWWYVTRRVNGKRVQIKLARGKENKTLAYQRYHEVMLDAGLLETASDPGFDELAAAFLLWTKRNVSRETARWYLHFLRDFKQHYGGTASCLNARHVENWLAAKSWSQSTRRQGITTIRRVVNWGYQEGRLKEFPVGLRNLKRPKMTRREKLVTDKEHQTILENTDEPFRQFLFALRETGARPIEIRTVTAEMVNLENGVWVFNNHKTAKKTGKPRVVYLTLTILELTRKLVKEYPLGSGPLFRNSHGKPWTANAVRCRMRRLRKKLGLDKGTVAYSYRHTYVTYALTRLDADMVAELVGHVDTKMIHEYYSHLDQRTGHMRKAAMRATGRDEPTT